jgi:protein-disulfide isomerase
VASRGEQRREARKKGGSEMTKFYYILGIVAVIGVAVVAYSVGSQAMSTAATQPVDVEGLDDMTKLVELAQGVTEGDQNAPITIVEFADYSCPGCGQFALTVKPQVVSQFVQTGKAKFVFYDFPLTSIHPHSFLAARAARCAGDQGKFWEFQDLLFRHQAEWATKNSIEGDLDNFAEQTGLDLDAFNACVNSDAHADVVSANMRLGNELGINQTPTVMVSAGKGMARRLSNYDFQGIAAEVDRLLADVNAPKGGS